MTVSPLHRRAVYFSLSVMEVPPLPSPLLHGREERERNAKQLRYFVSAGLTRLRWCGWLGLLLLGLGREASVEAAVGDPVTVRSQSGQFAVRGLPLGTNFTRSPTSQVDYLRL